MLMTCLCYVSSSYIHASDSCPTISEEQLAQPSNSFSSPVAVQPRTIENLLNDASFGSYDEVKNYIEISKEATFKFEVQRFLNFYKKLPEVSSNQEIFWGSYYNLKYSHQNLPL